jgi:hypothetical protein
MGQRINAVTEVVGRSDVGKRECHLRGTWFKRSSHEPGGIRDAAMKAVSLLADFGCGYQKPAIARHHSESWTSA